MLPSDFIYTANFPTLTTDQIQGGINAVEAMWSGALQFWSNLNATIRAQKQALLENLLVGWWLANTFPALVTGILANGGLPVSSKSIGGTSISFSEIESHTGLQALKSNSFGLYALEMIQSASEMYAVYG